MKRPAKALTITVFVVLVLFGIYNIAWFAIVGSAYRDFLPGMKEVYPLQTYVIEDLDGYTYNVKIPDYLSFIGNLGVQPSCGGQAALIIWPGILGDTQYGVMLPTGDGRIRKVYLSQDGEALPSASQDTKALVSENRDTIDELFKRARMVWDYR